MYDDDSNFMVYFNALIFSLRLKLKSAVAAVKAKKDAKNQTTIWTKMIQIVWMM